MLYNLPHIIIPYYIIIPQYTLCTCKSRLICFKLEIERILKGNVSAMLLTDDQHVLVVELSQ